ncbi:MAG: hypothetical protein Q7U88_14030 [Desulfocapsaceae bacterium]|nr:hypothetical protein [Desulfocapsaceae bacterium]
MADQPCSDKDSGIVCRCFETGRIHRFLIHDILSRRGLIPKGLMFPVSAAMLKNPALYDSPLELFSRSIMSLSNTR